MNLDRSLMFSYLEEDNVQKAYFRVRPLLSLEGDIRQEADRLYPGEGCLRIVPDRNEQHTFKTRMRSLGAYCAVDLRGLPADAGKIRTNKNFNPDRGEVNQYILYSDTVYPLPENSFYQIIEGTAEDYAAACEKAVTPRFYLRENDTLYGPVNRQSPQKPDPAREAAGTLYELPCPDGVTRTILCMDDSPAPAERPAFRAAAPAEQLAAPVQPAADTQPAATPAAVPAAPAAEAAPAKLQAAQAPDEDEALPIGKNLRILDETKDFAQTLEALDKPVSKGANLLNHREQRPPRPAPVPNIKPGELSGTPLVRTPLRTAVPQPKNRTQEVVANQLSVGKYEPPAQNLPAGAALRPVANPVETACVSLRQAWHGTDAQNQLLDCILSLDGVRGKLETRLVGSGHVTVMQRVLRDRLQDLEAERLTALCELDRAHRDVDAYKEELLSGLKARITRETGKLEADRADCETRVAELKREINALTAQRDALYARVDEMQHETVPAAVAKLLADAQMVSPMAGTPLRLAPVAGEQAEPEEMISRLSDACAAAGCTLPRNTAIAALTLLALCPRIGLVCPTPAPLSTLMRNIAQRFGWGGSYAHQIAPEQKPVTAARPVDAAPAVLLTSLPNFAALPGVSKLLLNRSAASLTRNVAYDAQQWPILTLPALPFVAEEPAQNVTAVSAASLAALLEKPAVTDAEISAILTPVLQAASPLSGAARTEMFRFVAACAGRMEGGLPVAADWAILLWIIPALERGGRFYGPVKAQLDEFPLSLAAM